MAEKRRDEALEAEKEAEEEIKLKNAAIEDL